MKVFWVSKRLAFGSAKRTSQHVEQLQALGVTHVINLRHGNMARKSAVQKPVASVQG